MWNRNRFVNFMQLTFINKKIEAKARTYACFVAIALGLSACSLGNSDGSSGPVISDQAIAFIKRPLLFEDDDPSELLSDDLRIPQSFRPGARLYLKANASPDAPAVDISSIAFSSAAYDVRDLNVSADGSQLVFSMRAPELDGVDP